MSSVMYIFSLHVIYQFWSAWFPPNIFWTRKEFGDKPGLIKELTCPGYFLSTFVWYYLSVNETSPQSSWRRHLIFLSVCEIFVEKFKLLIRFPMDLEVDFFLLVIANLQVKVRESVCCYLWYVVQLSFWQSCIWYT